jgi:hypothetical protein
MKKVCKAEGCENLGQSRGVDRRRAYCRKHLDIFRKNRQEALKEKTGKTGDN